MTKKLHGRTIELDEDPGVADGQEVELQIQIATARKWVRAFFAQRAVGSNIPRWITSWRKSIRSGSWNVVLKWTTNEPSIGYQYLFRSFSPAGWSGASVPSARG